MISCKSEISVLESTKSANPKKRSAEKTAIGCKRSNARGTHFTS